MALQRSVGVAITTRHQIRFPFQTREILGFDWLSTCAYRFRADIQLPSIRVSGTVCVPWSPHVCGKHVLCLEEPSLLSDGTVQVPLTPCSQTVMALQK